jgi:hypothetical protein
MLQIITNGRKQLRGDNPQRTANNSHNSKKSFPKSTTK